MHIRALQTDDLGILAQEVSDLWYDGTGDNAELLGKAELCTHLSHSDAGLVATDDDGRVLGVVLVQEAHGQNHPYALRDEACASGQQLWERMREPGIDNADIVLKAENALLGRAVEQSGQAGEIVLLVVTAAARGLGLGKRLMREGALWLAERDVTQVRLATDESCDWQVYEHLGMERVAQDTIGDDPSLEIYVYQMDTSALVKRLS